MMAKCRQAHPPTAQPMPWLCSPAPSWHHPWLLGGGKAPSQAGCQGGLRAAPVAQLPLCLSYLQQAALSWFRALTGRAVMCTWLTDVPGSVRNGGLQNICKTLCSSWGCPAALEQLGAHQGTTGLQSEELCLPQEGSSDHPQAMPAGSWKEWQCWRLFSSPLTIL